MLIYARTNWPAKFLTNKKINFWLIHIYIFPSFIGSKLIQAFKEFSIYTHFNLIRAIDMLILYFLRNPLRVVLTPKRNIFFYPSFNICLKYAHTSKTLFDLPTFFRDRHWFIIAIRIIWSSYIYFLILYYINYWRKY